MVDYTIHSKIVYQHGGYKFRTNLQCLAITTQISFAIIYILLCTLSTINFGNIGIYFENSKTAKKNNVDLKFF